MKEREEGNEMQFDATTDAEERMSQSITLCYSVIATGNLIRSTSCGMKRNWTLVGWHTSTSVIVCHFYVKCDFM